MEALLYRTNGVIEKVVPANGINFTLEEMQKYVDGFIQMIPLSNSRYFICNEEGAITECEPNYEATKVWLEEFPPEAFPLNNVSLIYGDVLITHIDNVN